MRFLQEPTRFYFFTGKGGVGKTSIACATAIHLARAGRRVLLVSTDPASNIAQVFGTPIGPTITPLRAVPGLDGLEMDPDAIADAYRERILSPVRGFLPAKDVAAITEQLSGACTTEIATFNEFTALLGDTEAVSGYDHVVFDTAPTGHTLRLLQLPGAWTSFLNDGKGDASCLGPMSGLDKHRSAYTRAVEALQDGHQTRMVLVARPQRASLAEAARTSGELRTLGIITAHLVVNGILPDSPDDDELAAAIRTREQDALSTAVDGVDLAVDQIALRPTNMVGVDALSTLFDDNSATSANATTVAEHVRELPGLGRLVDDLSDQCRGLVMAVGKGGVGKTTIAAAIALALIQRGHQVLLTTTDPASHLTLTLAGEVPGLSVSSIDPHTATQAYRDHVLATKGASLDEAGRAALAEDLQSPCTEEVAVFQAFSRAIAQARHQFVVMDTAPTGHTLLLLDATGSYHREVVRHLGDAAHLTTPMMRLQDPDYTKVLIVTLPETTPVLEAEQLQADLERAGIRPWAWVINNSLSAAATSNPLLAARAAVEAPLIEQITGHTERVVVVGTTAREPVGAEELAALTGSLTPA